MEALIGQRPADTTASIVDADQKTFVREAIEASRKLPVIVDFWASWCQPCKTLTPILEKVVRAAGGRVKLVKVDIDANQTLARQLTQMGLPLQSIPTVAAFWQGQIADMFQGAYPESEVRRFVEGLLKLAGTTSPAADLATEAKAALDANDAARAADLYGTLLEAEPENPIAWGGMLRALAALGEDKQARSLLAQVPPALAEHAEIAGARSLLALAEEGRQARGKLAAYEKRLAKDPGDHQARHDLATALNAAGDRARAADELLHIIRHDRAWNEDGARKQLLKFFEAWGLADPATLAARRKLSALLFS